MKQHNQAISGRLAGSLALVCGLLMSGAAAAQHQGLFERGPRASVTGEHGTYNIAWITITDQVLLQKPEYEVMVTYHSPRRGAGAVKQKHWDEMLQVATDEIARRCQPPAEWEVLTSWQAYAPSERGMGAELRVTYPCR